MKHRAHQIGWAAVLIAMALIAAAAAPPPLPLAKPEQVGLSQERLNRLGAFFQNEVAQGRVPGAVLLIARKGRIAYFESLGIRDPSNGAPMTKDSIFRVWSMSKPFTSVATMMFVEEGRILLTDPVSKYLPVLGKLEVSVQKVDPATSEVSYSTEPAKRQITVQDLLQHTSGLAYDSLVSNARVKELYQKEGVDLEADITNAQFVERVARVPLAHQPGAAFEYGISTDVLGRLVEVVAGMPLSEVLAKRIFEPLGMRDTGFFVPEKSLDRLAHPFANEPGTGKPVALFDVTRPRKLESGGGGAVSTASDYARFCQMLLNGGQLDGVRLLSRTTVRLMTSDHLGPSMAASLPPGQLAVGSPGYTFGLGFAVRREAGMASTPGSAGEFMWSGYANNYFLVDPQEQLIAILMTVAVGPPRYMHRRMFRQLVYQAIVD